MKLAFFISIIQQKMGDNNNNIKIASQFREKVPKDITNDNMSVIITSIRY
jgi:hypothetical protein